MANCNAIKIRPRRDKRTTAGNLAHNSAMTKASYWLKDGNDLLQSKTYKTHKELNEDWNTWCNEARDRYKNNPSKKRALRSDAILIEEGLIVIGTDVKVEINEIEKIIKDFVSKFEKDNNTKILHWSYHNHEGHKNDAGDEQINRHVHFLFDNIDQDGEMVRKNWKKFYFTQLQDDIFEVSKKYVKDIERAEKSEYRTIEKDGRKVKINLKRGTHHRRFRQDKINGKNKVKISDLKVEIKKLKTSMIETKIAEKADYDKLKKLEEKLRKRIKTQKDLSIEQLEKIINNFFNEYILLKQENIKLKEKVIDKEEVILELKILIEETNEEIFNLTDLNNTLYTKLDLQSKSNEELKKELNHIKNVNSLLKKGNEKLYKINDLSNELKKIDKVDSFNEFVKKRNNTNR